MNLLIALLFLTTPTCQSDFDSNCHRPARDWQHTIVYVSTDGNPDHDMIFTGPEVK